MSLLHCRRKENEKEGEKKILMKGTPKWTRGSILEQISEMEMPKDKERPTNFIVQADTE